MTVAKRFGESRVALSLHSMLEDDLLDGAAGARKAFQPYHAKSVPRSVDLEAAATESAVVGKAVTTMMLRNIPNKYTQNTLLQEIGDQGFVGTFDFFYLPMDVHNRSNVGYAFINFATPRDAERFRRKFSEHRFQRFQSRKISSVCAAHVQGLDANLRHFENRAVTHSKNGQYRPIVLQGNRRIDFDEALLDAKSRGDRPPPQRSHDTARMMPAPPTKGDTRPVGAAYDAEGDARLSGAAERDKVPGGGASCSVIGAGAPEYGVAARQGLELAIQEWLAAKGTTSAAPPQPPQQPQPDRRDRSRGGGGGGQGGVGGPAYVPLPSKLMTGGYTLFEPDGISALGNWRPDAAGDGGVAAARMNGLFLGGARNDGAVQGKAWTMF